ncbi:hypothetical protein HNR06_004944 [Nocardiopsis arvandica]|uniref:Uncharacterized protein n=1 Tax=Nocardiopsis sinuspersici TaxID=501010 RepID=A0A7Y9XJ25_9ACTN|nr:hypothetical protein [Nocardiopsis sinuspersici]
MHSVSRSLMPSGAVTGLAGVVSALAGAPWWLTAAAFGCFMLVLLIAAVQSVFPQESADRLAWWRDRRLYQHLRRHRNRQD